MTAKRAGYGERIVSALGRQLSWTHFKSLIYIEDPLARDFYPEMSRLSTRTPACFVVRRYQSIGTCGAWGGLEALRDSWKATVMLRIASRGSRCCIESSISACRPV